MINVAAPFIPLPPLGARPEILSVRMLPYAAGAGPGVEFTIPPFIGLGLGVISLLYQTFCLHSLWEDQKKCWTWVTGTYNSYMRW